MALDVLIPQHRQRDVLALELAVDLAPIGLDVTPMTLFGTDRSEQYRFQRAVGHLSRQRPAQPRACQPFQRQPDSRWRNTYAAGNLIEPDPGGSQTKHFAHSAHRQPLCWHPLPRVNPKGRTLIGPAEAPPNRARSSRNGGRNHLGKRHQIGMLGDIIADSRATSPGIRNSALALVKPSAATTNRMRVDSS